MGIKLTKTIKARATSDGLTRAFINKAHKLNITNYENIFINYAAGLLASTKGFSSPD